MRKFDSFSLIVVIVCSLFFFIFGVGLTAFTALESVVGDVATWVAAVGTVSTLFFLIWQNFKLQKVQAHRDKEDSIVKKSQYLENRKQNFYVLLEEFKNETPIPIEYLSKYSLYKLIYPSRTKASEQYHDACPHFSTRLKKASVAFQLKLDALDDKDSNARNVHEMFEAMTKLQSLLKFELTGTNMIVNSSNSRVLAKLFHFNKTLATYHQVVSMIDEECNLNLSVQPFHISLIALRRLEHFMFQKGLMQFNLGMPNYAKSAVKHLNKLYQLTYNPEGETSFEYYPEQSLMDLFLDEQRFWCVVMDKQKLLEQLVFHSKELADTFIEDDPSLESKIQVLKKQLEVDRNRIRHDLLQEQSIG